MFYGAKLLRLNSEGIKYSLLLTKDKLGMKSVKSVDSMSDTRRQGF